MKYNYILIFFFVFSCSSINTTSYKKQNLNSKGFAYIYSQNDYNNKFITKKIDPTELLIGHNQIRRGAIIKISNPRNKKNIITKNSFKVNYPDFYKIFITKPIAQKLDLSEDFPYVEIEELRKNKSFIAKKAIIFQEEKQLHDKAPVEKVKIKDISKTTSVEKTKKPKFVIILGNFYSHEAAKLLIERINSETNAFKTKKISILKRKKHNYEVYLGPYNTIKMIKNDYIALKQINFDEVDIKIYD